MLTVRARAATVRYAVVVANQAVMLVTASRPWSVWLVAVWLVGASEIEPAHFSVLLALGMFHEEGVSSVQWGQVVKIAVCFFWKKGVVSICNLGVLFRSKGRLTYQLPFCAWHGDSRGSR